jgi:DNA-binding transcriptional MerR regulator
VSRLTGIGIDTLRAWERRYGAVSPGRDERGRLYTDADVARLRLLQQAVLSGHSIGRLAPLSDAELRRLPVAHAPAARSSRPASPPAVDASILGAALLAFENAAIDHEFSRLAAVLPPLSLVTDVLLPTLRDVGDRWNRRRGGIAHEHLMSSAMRHLLGSFLRLYSRRDAPARLLFATPAGERHEIGILCAAMLAASRGLSVSYVGPDLPAEEIVEAVNAADARALVLGLTLTGNNQPKGRELRVLLRDLRGDVELWAGGPGTVACQDVLNSRALTLPDFDTYLMQLGRFGGVAR